MGDTLFRIALRFKTTVAVLKAANGLTSNTIYPGQVLIIPGAAAATSRSMTYLVRPGDTLFRIALNHGITVAALMRANGLTTTRIYAGQRLIIPGP